MFLSYYLQGLTVENGCLQVVPGQLPLALAAPLPIATAR